MPTCRTDAGRTHRQRTDTFKVSGRTLKRWTCGPATLFLGDCRDAMATMRKDYIDITVTSPPYNTLNAQAVATTTGRAAGWAKKVREVGYFDDRPELEYQGWLASIVERCMHLSKGVVWINHKTRYRSGEAIHPLRFLPFPIHADVIWDRRNSISFNNKRPANSHEYLTAFGRPHWWDRLHDGKLSVWTITPTIGDMSHPCPFPLEIAKRPIESSCPPGGRVLDPFMGVATTGIAAIKAGRRFIGCEMEQRFFVEAKRRVLAAIKER